MVSERVSMQPPEQSSLQHVPWEQINSPGAYVEVGTGKLFRIPPHGLVQGGSPVIRQTTSQASLFAKLSADPYLIVHEARCLAADNNIQPNF